MSLFRLAILSLVLAVPAPALAAPKAPAAPPPAPAAAPAPNATADVPASPPLPAASSSVVISLGTTGDFDRKSVTYGCEGDASSITVDYINAAPNYLALIPLDGSTLVFNTVLAASGAKYVAGKYVWWTKGNTSSLYDLTLGDNAKPILTCGQVNDTP